MARLMLCSVERRGSSNVASSEGVCARGEELGIGRAEDFVYVEGRRI